MIVANPSFYMESCPASPHCCRAGWGRSAVLRRHEGQDVKIWLGVVQVVSGATRCTTCSRRAPHAHARVRRRVGRAGTFYRTLSSVCSQREVDPLADVVNAVDGICACYSGGHRCPGVGEQLPSCTSR